ncbi:UNVERIFIED_CONTAM: hypothetical protein FKN15_043638 [Acipenser sinensis]
MRQGGKAAFKTKHLIPTEGEERSAAGGELPVAVTRQGTASGSLRGKRKAQARLPTCAQKCTRTGLMVGVPGGAKEGPPKPKRPPRRPPSAGNEGPGPRNATERVKDPSPEAAPEAAGPSAPPESAQGEKAIEWTVVARRKKAAAASSTGVAKQGTTKPAIAPSGGGSGGVPEKGIPSPEPPVRQGGKAARKTKHLTSEGQEHAATGDRTPASTVQRGTDSRKAGKKRKAEANLPTVARKCNRTGPASTIVGPVAGGGR